MNSLLQRATKPVITLGRNFWVAFLIACAITAFSEALFDRLVEGEETPGITQSIFNLSGLYQRIVAAPRNPIPRYTVVVEINPKKDPTAVTVLTSICDQRAMISRLLYIVADALPGVIVLDKYYLPRQPSPCKEDPDLVRAIQDVRHKKNIPVIVGRRVSDESAGERYYLMPSMRFGNPEQEGVVNIDPDTRKLPLKWLLFPSEEEASVGRNQSWYGTLALQASSAYDNSLFVDHPEVEKYYRSWQHPFISFLSPSTFHPVLICQVLSTENCPQPTIESRRLSGKVVLIGEINPDLDSHPTVVGPMPGLYLQANYIEALLDDRYYRPMPALDYVFGFAILAVLELILIVYRGRWWTMAMLIVALFALTIAMLYLIVMHLRWYVNPVLVGATAVAIKGLNLLFSKAEKIADRDDHTPDSHQAAS